ncbi:MAG: hypothetical protein JWN15_2616 [Firmicutes bacterium]|nr:hypothetical protein [Bacillota bacterium]
MVRIAVGGQVDRKKVAELARKVGGDRVQVTDASDLEAAMAVKNGKADYYFGACHTGGGGLAMAIAMLGKPKCETVSMPGRPPKEEQIRKAVESGIVGFGFTADHAEQAVSMIVKAILERSPA